MTKWIRVILCMLVLGMGFAMVGCGIYGAPSYPEGQGLRQFP